MMQLMETFGEALKRIRKANNISVRSLARTVGVSASYISFLENNKKPAPPAPLIKKLSTALGVTSAELSLFTGRLDPEITEYLESSLSAAALVRLIMDLGMTDADIASASRMIKRNYFPRTKSQMFKQRFSSRRPSPNSALHPQANTRDDQNGP